jgi:hypothetical protein
MDLTPGDQHHDNVRPPVRFVLHVWSPRSLASVQEFRTVGALFAFVQPLLLWLWLDEGQAHTAALLGGPWVAATLEESVPTALMLLTLAARYRDAHISLWWLLVQVIALFTSALLAVLGSILGFGGFFAAVLGAHPMDAALWIVVGVVGWPLSMAVLDSILDFANASSQSVSS